MHNVLRHSLGNWTTGTSTTCSTTVALTTCGRGPSQVCSLIRSWEMIWTISTQLPPELPRQPRFSRDLRSDEQQLPRPCEPTSCSLRQWDCRRLMSLRCAAETASRSAMDRPFGHAAKRKTIIQHCALTCLCFAMISATSPFLHRLRRLNDLRCFLRLLRIIHRIICRPPLDPRRASP